MNLLWFQFNGTEISHWLELLWLLLLCPMLIICHLRLQLNRLFKIKYESGTLEELLYVDMPHEHQNSSGQIVLDYAKAIQESVFEQLRVVRDGQLRIVFSPDLKVYNKQYLLLIMSKFSRYHVLICSFLFPLFWPDMLLGVLCSAS